MSDRLGDLGDGCDLFTDELRDLADGVSLDFHIEVVVTADQSQGRDLRKSCEALSDITVASLAVEVNVQLDFGANALVFQFIPVDDRLIATDYACCLEFLDGSVDLRLVEVSHSRDICRGVARILTEQLEHLAFAHTNAKRKRE